MQIKVLTRWFIGGSAVLSVMTLIFVAMSHEHRSQERQALARQVEVTELSRKLLSAVARMNNASTRYVLSRRDNHYQTYWNALRKRSGT